MWDTERDSRLGGEAMAWLAVRTHDGARPIGSEELGDFRFEGQPFRLLDAQRGIWKPAKFASALSIRTVYRSPGRPRPYDDRSGPDGMLRYKWRGEDGEHWENRALRAAMNTRVPLIWFFGVGDALYEPIYPIYVLGEEPEQGQFVVDPDVGRGLVSVGSVVEEQLRRYIVTQTRRRLHQPVFRATVMRAYRTRCSVCALAHGELLDAAHILPDSSPGGIATVRNGLALCKRHHAAFDANILGINADLVVSIREDLLSEIDGPVLQHGLQERHGERLRIVPSARSEHPDPEFLDGRFQAFLAAAATG